MRSISKFFNEESFWRDYLISVAPFAIIVGLSLSYLAHSFATNAYTEPASFENLRTNIIQELKLK